MATKPAVPISSVSASESDVALFLGGSLRVMFILALSRRAQLRPVPKAAGRRNRL